MKGPNGERVKGRTHKWYVGYFDADGIRRRMVGYADKEATRALASDLERKVEREKAGVIDRFADLRKLPLSQHLENFEKSLLDKGNTPKHSSMTVKRVRTVLDACGFKFIQEVSASKVSGCLASMRATGGIGAETSNHYLRALKGFFSWMVRNSVIPVSPLAHLSLLNPEPDRRYERRVLSSDELRRLISVTFGGAKYKTRRSPPGYMSGKARAILYMVAATTGLRAGELRSLTWESFNLAMSKPTVTLAAAYSKRRRKDVLPLRLDVAGELRQWCAERGDGNDALVFNLPEKTAKMFQADLEAAGIAIRDGSGRVADFHALRHTFITNLVKGGVSPKVAQTLVRHSTITLTMDRYSHLELHDQAAALDVLPGMTETEAESITYTRPNEPVVPGRAPLRPLLPKSRTVETNCAP